MHYIFLNFRLTFTLYGIVSGVATLLMPLFVSFGFPALIVVRILQGAGAGTTLAAIGMFANSWCPLASMGFVISIISSYVQLGPLYTMSLASEFCNSPLGWQGTFYQQGALTLIFMIIFFFMYKDSPKDHKFVTEKELNLIEKGKNSAETSESRYVPYLKIFTDYSVWGILFCAFGNLLSQQIFLIYGPVYLNQILKLNVEKVGFSGFLANFLCLFLKLSISPISDYGKCVNQKNKAKIIMTVSHAIITAAFFTLAFIDHNNQLLGQICYMVTIILSSLQSVGFMKTNQLVSV